MDCPSDSTLRSLLQDGNAKSVAADLAAHFVRCQGCRDRATHWGELARLDQLSKPSGTDTSTAHPSVHDPSVHTVEETPTPTKPTDALTVTFTPEPRRRVGNYELMRMIGRGGGGEVYEALHTRLRKQVAIKVLSSKNAGDEHARLRFFREMESIGRLNHPHIVQAHDAGEVDGVLYLAMELIDGSDVESLARRVSIPIADACEIVRQAALGVQHAHEHGLVHRDLKPSNLLLASGSVKVADLGMALLRRTDSGDDRLTDSCVIMGTGDYMAPEQSEGAHHLDIRADLYSLGCTLYRLLGGRPPFASIGKGSVMTKLMAHVHEPVPDISVLRPEIPFELKAILAKLLAKQKQDRYQEPRELAETLAQFCAGSNLKHLATSQADGQNEIVLDDLQPILTPPASPQPTTIRLGGKGEGRKSPINSQRLALALGGLCLLAVLIVGVRNRNHRPDLEDADLNSEASASEHSSSGLSLVAPTHQESSHSRISHNPATDIAKPVPQAETVPVLGPLQLRWEKEFERLPAEVMWPGRQGFGTWRLDEETRSLVLQTKKAFRFVSLGQLTEEQPQINLKFDVLPLSKDGDFGIYLGMKIEKNDNPRFTYFQAIQVGILPATPTQQEFVVRRYIGKLDGQTGIVHRDRNQHQIVRIPTDRDQLQLELRVANSNLQFVKFCGTDCFDLTSSVLNSTYSKPEYVGDFGVFAQDSTVSFSNPVCERNVP